MIVTLELKTPWWKTFLRAIKLMKKRDEFEIVLKGTYFIKGERVLIGPNTIALVLKP